MTRQSFIALVLSVCFSAGAFANTGSNKLPGTWDEIVKDPSIIKSPTVEETRQQAVAATGEPQLYKVGEQFLFLFDERGQPVVTFDLTMDQISFFKGLLGGVGIGDWTLWRVFKKLKKARSQEEAAATLDDAEDTQDFTIDAEAKAAGYKLFADLEFKEEWARRNGFIGQIKDRKASGFKPADFTLNDLAVPANEQPKIDEAMADFSKLIYGERLQGADLDVFKSSFQLKWDAKSEKFDVYFNNLSNKKPKAPTLPAWVINYTTPLDILAYKYYLNSVNNTLATLETLFGNYAKVFGIVVGKMIGSIKNQYDSHENQLLALLQAAERGEYTLNVPLLKKQAFLEATIDILYLDKIIETQDITNGKRKRKQIVAEEHVAHEKNMKWLAKHGYAIAEFPNQKFAHVTKKGKDEGIVNLAVKGFWLTRRPHRHYNPHMPALKEVSRVSWELIADAVRYVAPRELYIGDWLARNIGISIDIYIPGEAWDRLFQGNKYVETAYEGELISLLNEQIRGRYTGVPLAQDQLKKVRTWLYRQRLNPYDVHLDEEAAAIKANYQLVLDLLNGGPNMNTGIALPTTH